MSEATIPIKELMEKTEQWLLGQGYKKSTLGFYRATQSISEATLLSYQMKENGSFHLLVAIILLKQSMIIFASCYSHAIFLQPE